MGTGRYGEGLLPGVASPPLAANVPSVRRVAVGEPDPDEPSPLQAASTRARERGELARRPASAPGSATDQALGEVRRHLVEGDPLCFMVSRSRMVTAWSSRVSKSTVTQYGVPTSSWRR